MAMKVRAKYQVAPRTPGPGRTAIDPQADHNLPLAVVGHRARLEPSLWSSPDVAQLQRAIGNRAVSRMLAGLPRSEGQATQPGETARPLPVALRSGVEALAKVDMSDVRVFYNSPRPAQVNACAYARGRDIYLGSGHTEHLPHEAWHVVQQKRGVVSPTGRVKGAAVNDDVGLERQADVMGEQATRVRALLAGGGRRAARFSATTAAGAGVVQRNGKTSKEILDDMTDPTIRRRGTISGDDLRFLLEEAAKSALRTYAYQATKSAAVGSISTSGLDPQYGGTGASKGVEAFEKQSRGQVHYTRSLNTAADYRDFFQGGTPFGPHRQVDQPGPAEILQITLPKELLGVEELDPDSPSSQKSFRTKNPIPGQNIRSLKPRDVPQQAGPLKPGANADAWIDYVQRGNIESEALFSNMSATAQKRIRDLVGENDALDKNTILGMLKQGLKSMKTSDILEFAELTKANLPARFTLSPTGQ